MKRFIFVLVIIAFLTPTPTSGRLNPLRYLTDRVVRPEIMIVFDNSGSMRGQASGDGWSNTTGNDCSGNDANVDKCGDYMCSGYERWQSIPCAPAGATYPASSGIQTAANNRCKMISPKLICDTSNADTAQWKCNTGKTGTAGTVCAQDCSIFDDYYPGPGSPEKCSFYYWSTPLISRMHASKRALQNVLTDFRTVASFGFIPFKQTGFFRYDKADPMLSTKVTGLYLHQWELRGSGSWTGGAGWDVGLDKPANMFTANQVTYYLLNTKTMGLDTNISASGNSLYRRGLEEITPSWKGWQKCTQAKPCKEGEGDCDQDNPATCQTGLVCAQDKGLEYWSPGEIDLTLGCPNGRPGDACRASLPPYTIDQIDVCEKPLISPSGYEYKRMDWAGQFYNDGTYNWQYLGSYYTYTAHTKASGVPAVWRGWDGCSVASPCSENQGDCDNTNQCQAGLVCTMDVGSQYFSDLGFDPSLIDLCMHPPNYQDTFKGPEYSDGANLWIYNRYGSGFDNTVDAHEDYGIAHLNEATVAVPLIESTTATPQSSFDGSLSKILNYMNSAQTGGMYGGCCGTPTCSSLETAYAHFQSRINGQATPVVAIDSFYDSSVTSGTTAADGTPFFINPDEAGSCRPRFILVLSDGASTTACTTSLSEIVTKLRTDFNVKTYAVTIPGLDEDDLDEMNAIARCGSAGCNCVPGTDTGCHDAFYSNNEKELVDNIRTVLFDAIKGQFTTASAGTATSGTTAVTGDIAIIPSTEYPGWRGHIRAVDMTKVKSDPNYQLWEAGEILKDREWQTRKLYTGRADVSNGDPIPLFDANGTVNTAGISSVWPSAAIDVAGTQAIIKWLAGKDRSWKLPPLIRTVPATIGPPPNHGASEHDAFHSAYIDRQYLFYVSSNEGLIHAFDISTGAELFAYVPPHLFDKIKALYLQGGQDADPNQFQYILASSSRIEDLKDTTNGWRTILVQPDGPNGEEFVALDITNPTTCTSKKDTTTCSLNTKPFTVVFNSTLATGNIGSKFGETWSHPTLYWDSSAVPQMSVASGYDTLATSVSDSPVYSGQGRWSNHFTIIGSSWNTTPDSGFYSFEHGIADSVSASITATVEPRLYPYTVLADTVTAIYDDNNAASDRHVIATYQADLVGRIYRFEQGNTTSAALILDAENLNPFHFAPSAIWRADTRVTLAANSGAFQEDDIIPPAATALAPVTSDTSADIVSSGDSFTSTLYMRTEESANPSALDNFTCAINNVCETTCYNGGTVDPSSCTAPAARALPVSQPILIENIGFGGRIEAFYLYYEPPATICDGTNLAVGNSYVIRVATMGATQRLVNIKKFENTQSSGLTILGGGADVGVTVGGRGSEQQDVYTYTGNPIPSTGFTDNSLIIEGWREVR